MPTSSRNTLKNWFKRGLKPLEVQFASWLDSYWHKDDDLIPMAKVEDLIDTLNAINPGNVVVDCGGHNASTNLFPTVGGTGTAGAIKRGNQFDITVAGTLDGVDVEPGATIRAKVDEPAQTLANWRIYY